MYRVVLLPLAIKDIKEATHWYNNRQKGLGKRFTHSLRDKVKFISQNPKSTAIRYDNTRTALLDVFPCMIHYFLDDEKKTVIIAAVFHTSRNPDIWKNRK